MKLKEGEEFLFFPFDEPRKLQRAREHLRAETFDYFIRRWKKASRLTSNIKSRGAVGRRIRLLFS